MVQKQDNTKIKYRCMNKIEKIIIKKELIHKLSNLLEITKIICNNSKKKWLQINIY
jgi:hypothetical protein